MRVSALLTLLIAGCATTSGGDMNAAKITWAGVTYDQVVASWGQPGHYTTLSDGGYVYTWVSENVEPRGRVYPSLSFFGGSGGGVAIGAGATVAPGGGELVRCTRTLVFRDARVAEQTWQGNPAFCDSFRR
jgi:hypothetical protein